MFLLDDNTPTLMAVAAAQKNGGTPPPPPQDEFGQTVMAQDSISRALSDSIKNMDLNDLKDAVTGENTIIKDGKVATFEDLEDDMDRLC